MKSTLEAILNHEPDFYPAQKFLVKLVIQYPVTGTKFICSSLSETPEYSKINA